MFRFFSAPAAPDPAPEPAHAESDPSPAPPALPPRTNTTTTTTNTTGADQPRRRSSKSHHSHHHSRSQSQNKSHSNRSLHCPFAECRYKVPAQDGDVLQLHVETIHGDSTAGVKKERRRSRAQGVDEFRRHSVKTGSVREKDRGSRGAGEKREREREREKEKVVERRPTKPEVVVGTGSKAKVLPSVARAQAQGPSPVPSVGTTGSSGNSSSGELRRAATVQGARPGRLAALFGNPASVAVEAGGDDAESDYIDCPEEDCCERVLFFELQEHMDFHSAQHLAQGEEKAAEESRSRGKREGGKVKEREKRRSERREKEGRERRREKDGGKRVSVVEEPMGGHRKLNWMEKAALMLVPSGAPHGHGERVGRERERERESREKRPGRTRSVSRPRERESKRSSSTSGLKRSKSSSAADEPKRKSKRHSVGPPTPFTSRHPITNSPAVRSWSLRPRKKDARLAPQRALSPRPSPNCHPSRPPHQPSPYHHRSH